MRAHARRKFYEARLSNPAIAHAAMAWIGRLYEVEGRARELDAHSRCAVRQEDSRPLHEYWPVPPDVHQALLNAESIGRYFNTHIKDCYHERRVR